MVNGSDKTMLPGRATAVVGLQWGDEGKGKIVDRLAAEHDAVVRYNGGANAGHSVVVKGERHALHLTPSGILHPGKLSVIANGVVVDPSVLLRELETLSARGVDVFGLRVSDRAHVTMPYHIAEDEAREAVLSGGARGEGGAIGTTKRGIGPSYAEKVQRAAAVRIGDLLRPAALREKIGLACEIKARTLSGLAGGGEPALDPPALVELATSWGAALRGSIVDTFYLLHDTLDSGKKLLFEGANGALLDVDHGTYPFVTSSNTTTLAVGSGSGVSSARLDRVVGVAKAYSTRVGAGPFPTEESGAAGERIREKGKEFGTTTGRPRRCGWLDLVALRYTARLNACTELAVMLLDVLGGFDELRVCVAYEIDGERTDRFAPDSADLSRAVPVYETVPGFDDSVASARRRGALPEGAQRYVERIEEAVGVPVKTISVGPDREQTIVE